MTIRSAIEAEFLPEGQRGWYGYFLLIVAVWALTYLVNLGTSPFVAGEGMRYELARGIIATSDWLNLQSGGAPYYAKPPLAFWLIAVGLRLFGPGVEWAARLPFAGAVLAMALVVFFSLRRLIGPSPAALAALAPILTLGMLQSGRSCEIDNLYAALTVATTVLWAYFWIERRQGAVPITTLGALIGATLLTKGPLALAIFGVVCAFVLVRARDHKAAVLPLAAALLGIAIASIWIVQQVATAGEAAYQTWWGEMSQRFQPGRPPSEWINEFAHALAMTLPFGPMFLAGFLPGPRATGRADALITGARDAVAVCFVGILAWPGMKSYYLLPVIELMSIVAMIDWWRRPGFRALLLRAGLPVTAAIAAIPVTIGVWRLWSPSPQPILAAWVAAAAVALVLVLAVKVRHTTAAHLIVAAGMAGLGFSLMLVPALADANHTRQGAAAINAAVPRGATLMVVGASDELTAYLDMPFRKSRCTGAAEWLLVPRGSFWAGLAGSTAAAPVSIVAEVQDFIGWRTGSASLMLLHVRDSERLSRLGERCI